MNEREEHFCEKLIERGWGTPDKMAELRKDAERYRCLRDDMTHEHCGPFVGWTLDILLPGDDPDDAIDKRIRKKLGE